MAGGEASVERAALQLTQSGINSVFQGLSLETSLPYSFDDGGMNDDEDAELEAGDGQAHHPSTKK